MGSQFRDLDFTQGASHDPGLGIFLAHDFQDMDGEPGDFTMFEGHGHPLVYHDNNNPMILSILNCVILTSKRSISPSRKRNLSYHDNNHQMPFWLPLVWYWYSKDWFLLTYYQKLFLVAIITMTKWFFVYLCDIYWYKINFTL